jgi:antirestriction protein
MNTPTIYVACVAAYNMGRLHGTWIDADQDSEDIQEQIDEMLGKSPCRRPSDWRIDDHEHWNGINPSNFALEDLSKICELLENHDEDAVAAALDYDGNNVDNAECRLRNGYGIYASEKEYAEEYLENGSCEVPDFLQGYIDTEKLGRDLVADSSTSEHEGRLIVWHT